MKIIYKKVRDSAVLPKRSTDLSGGLDVTASHIEKISESEVVVYLGLKMQPKTNLATNYMIRFSPRSSFTKYNWILQNSPCLGDADFTGEYRLRFQAIPVDYEGYKPGSGGSMLDRGMLYEPFPYEVGNRVAQMWVEEVLPIDFEEGELENHTDRKGGFGSTGK